MNAEDVLRGVGQVAGIGGLAISLFLLVARTVLRTLPRPATVREPRFFRTIDKIILYTFILSLIGIIFYAFLEINRRISTLAPMKEKYASLSEKCSRLEKDYAELNSKFNQIPEPNLKGVMAGFEVLSSDVTFDLTNWAEVPVEEQQTKKRSYVVTRTKRVVSRASHEIKEFAATYATASSLDPDFVCKTHKMRVIRNEDQEQNGKVTLRRWILRYDVSDEPLYTPFPIITEITGWNSLPNPVKEQEGTIILFPTRSASLEVLFPVHKRPIANTIECFSYPLAEGQSPTPVNNPNLITAPDRSWVKWIIEEPRLGHHYEIHWKW